MVIVLSTTSTPSPSALILLLLKVILAFTSALADSSLLSLTDTLVLLEAADLEDSLVLLEHPIAVTATADTINIDKNFFFIYILLIKIIILL